MAFFEDTKSNLTIKRMTSGPLPVAPFVAMKNTILGKEYELSILFPTTAISKQLHKAWKNKKDPVNILSFPIEENSGEIVITLGQARKEAPKFGYSYKDYLIFLLIHGLVHLRGLDHGNQMESLEQKYRKKFNIAPPVHS